MSKYNFQSLATGGVLAVALASSSAVSTTAFASTTQTSSQPVLCKTSDIIVSNSNADLSQVTVSLVKHPSQSSCDVSLNSYKADGPTWPTSGVQALIDHDHITLTQANPSAVLTVTTAPCFGQNDLYLGVTRFDGTDGQLPKYPTSTVPTGLLGHWNGGQACTEVTPAPVTSNDVCGTDQDSYVIPTKEGVEYQVNGKTTAAGTYNGSGKVTVTAVAKAGYVLAGTTSWTFTFASDACPAPKVSVVEAECVENGVKVTLTNTGNADGTATVNGKTVTVKAGETTSVTLPLDAQYSANVKVTIDGKTVLEKTVTCAIPETPVTPVTPSTPQILSASTTVPAELPSTGINSDRVLVVGTAAATAIYVAFYFLQDKFALLRRR